MSSLKVDFITIIVRRSGGVIATAEAR